MKNQTKTLYNTKTTMKNHTHSKYRTQAFSLLELMFALVAISLFLAAFAPVITNKYSKESAMVFNNGQLITSEGCENYFQNEFNLKCTLCYGKEACVTCGGNCPLGKIKEKAKCTCR